MTFRLLTKEKDGRVELAGDGPGYTGQSEAMESAKILCQTSGATILVVQDVAEVQMAPLVSTLTEPVTPKGPVYRSAAAAVQAEVDEIVGPPRVPQTRPRLLVLKDRQATPAEVVGHLMVVAEGRVVKNAFGGLTLDELPLVGAEIAEVASALGKG